VLGRVIRPASRRTSNGRKCVPSSSTNRRPRSASAPTVSKQAHLQLGGALPSVSVGSVDKFQGQEAPVVIVSMCASSGEASPRGIEFLFNPNRLNVALSRAQSLAIVVGSPELARTRVTSVGQMRWVNLFCRVRGCSGPPHSPRRI
jgi:hypothetical protein